MMRRFSITICALALLALFVLPVSGREIKVHGVLGRTVEAGGWVILTKGKEKIKYLLLNPQRFRNQSWFRVGAEVEATGEILSDIVTIYQEGVPFEARAMKPRSETRRRRR